MDREELLKALVAVEPARANSQMVPIFSHYWFNGDWVQAFNDHISIVAPCELPIEGAIPHTLLPALKSSKVKVLQTEADAKSVRFTLGTASFLLQCTPREDFEAVFKFPKSRDAEYFDAPLADVLDALEDVLPSVASETSNLLEYQGVTVIAEQRQLLFVATNGNVMAVHAVDCKEPPLWKRITLRADFCRLLLKHGKEGRPELYVQREKDGRGFALLVTDDVKVYGKLIFVDKPQDFVGVLDKYASEAVLAKAVEVPSKLPAALERATIFAQQSKGEPIPTNVRLAYEEGDQANPLWADFETTNPAVGDARDEIQFGQKHGATRLSFRAKSIAAASSRYTHTYFGAQAIVFVDKENQARFFLHATASTVPSNTRDTSGK